MTLSEQFYQSEKTGYLNEQFRLFHIKDQTKKEFAYTIAFFITMLFSAYMLGDLFGVLPPGFIEQFF